MRNLRVGLMAVLCALWAGAVWADDVRAPVPRTGQVLCYDISGSVVTCAGTGQDGALQKGVKIPTPRFTDKGNGTIKDNLTGLTWLKNANCPGTGRDWQTALDDVASLNTSGTMNGNSCSDTSGKGGTHRTDWRLPNIRELHSLVDYAFRFPAISNAAGTANGTGSDPFSNFELFGSTYWSSTSDACCPDFKWVVQFGVGAA